ncbi:hypothetical protein ACFYWP_40300 [Actinacidiphila glaucinigra]|uniref:hypothetical protein n=1 Tax=Actinacidiphila glaucinigra TaxID=235986 RepID=UPI0036782CC4
MFKRHGWTCRIPVRRAMEPDEAAVASCVEETSDRAWNRGSARRVDRLRKTKPASQ